MSQEKNWLERRDAIEVALMIVGSLAICLISYMFYMMPIWQAQHDADKAHIDSLDCKSLGQWLIDNAETRTDSKDFTDSNYHYAQAKYLVCTHGGLSP